MNFDEFRRQFPRKLQDIKDFVNGDEVKDIIGVEAVNHFKESFQNEGFTDETLNPWKDVQRRNPSSTWFGHSGQTGRKSDARKSAKILSGETLELQNAITYRRIPGGARISNDKPYASVHNYGGQAKIYGKKGFTMPKRQFIGRSAVLVNNINNKIKRRLIGILKTN